MCSSVFCYLAVLMDLLHDPLWHFFLAFFPGLLLSALMLTIYSRLYRLTAPGMSQRIRSAVVGCMVISCLLALVSVALLSHYFLDYVWYAWNRPLGEPLDLVVPND